MKILAASFRNAAKSFNDYVTLTVQTVAVFPPQTHQEHAGEDRPGLGFICPRKVSLHLELCWTQKLSQSEALSLCFSCNHRVNLHISTHFVSHAEIY